MIPVFGLLIWAGYGIYTYGWVLVKGYNITPQAWFSPVHTFQWSSNPGKVPQGQVFPGGSSSGGSSSASSASSASPASPAGSAAGATGAGERALTGRPVPGAPK